MLNRIYFLRNFEDRILVKICTTPIRDSGKISDAVTSKLLKEFNRDNLKETLRR